MREPRTGSATEALGRHSKDALEQVRNSSGNMTGDVSSMVETHPLAAIGIAAMIGFVIGSLTR